VEPHRLQPNGHRPHTPLPLPVPSELPALTVRTALRLNPRPHRKPNRPLLVLGVHIPIRAGNPKCMIKQTLSHGPISTNRLSSSKARFFHAPLGKARRNVPRDAKEEGPNPCAGRWGRRRASEAPAASAKLQTQTFRMTPNMRVRKCLRIERISAPWALSGEIRVGSLGQASSDQLKQWPKAWFGPAWCNAEGKVSPANEYKA